MLRFTIFSFLFFACIACKKDEATFSVPIQVERESYIIAIDAHTGLYNMSIHIETLDALTDSILSQVDYSDTLLLLSRNGAHNLLFEAWEFAFDSALNRIPLYEESKPLIFKSLDNQEHINRYLYLDTAADILRIESREHLPTGEIIVKTYEGVLN